MTRGIGYVTLKYRTTASQASKGKRDEHEQRLKRLFQEATEGVSDPVLEDGVSFTVALNAEGSVEIRGFSNPSGAYLKHTLESDLQERVPEHGAADALHELLFGGEKPIATQLVGAEGHVYVLEWEIAGELKDYVYEVERAEAEVKFTIWGESPAVAKEKQRKAAFLLGKRKLNVEASGAQLAATRWSSSARTASSSSGAVSGKGVW